MKKIQHSSLTRLSVDFAVRAVGDGCIQFGRHHTGNLRISVIGLDRQSTKESSAIYLLSLIRFQQKIIFMIA